jgi:hypothetical protein
MMGKDVFKHTTTGHDEEVFHEATVSGTHHNDNPAHDPASEHKDDGHEHHKEGSRKEGETTMKTQIARTLAILGLSALFVFGFAANNEAKAAEFELAQTQAAKFQDFNTAKFQDFNAANAFRDANFEFTAFKTFDARAFTFEAASFDGFNFTAFDSRAFSFQDFDFEAVNFGDIGFKADTFKGADFKA